MSSLLIEGQARLQPIARAIEALLESDDGGADDGADDVVDVEGLLWAWRRLQPRCHAGAGDDAFAREHDAVDVDAIVDVLARRPGLLDDSAPVLLPLDEDPRGTPFRQQVARALADALTLGLERQKLRHGLTASPASLKQRFASPDVARATLQALVDGELPRLRLPRRADPSWSLSPRVAQALAQAIGARGQAPAAVHVLVGDVGRTLDLLSPGVRRLRVDLALLGRDGVVDDDDVYRGLDRLYARVPAAVTERRSHPDEAADDGAVFVVDSSGLHEDAVDRRARSLVVPLKKAHVVVVGIADVRSLPAVLSALVAHGPLRSIVILGASCAPPASSSSPSSPSSSSSSGPSVLFDGTGGIVPLSGDGPALLSVPWSGLLPADLDASLASQAAVDVAAAVTAVWRARLLDERVPTPTVQVVAEGSRSAAALQALASMIQLRR